MSANSTLLFTPLILPSGIRLQNRIVMAPMTTYSSNPDGTVTDAELDYLRRRSAGMGMILTAACYVIPEGKAFPGQWGCHSDEMTASLAKAADVIHEAGARAVLQIHHGGRMSPASLLGHAPLSASAVAAERPGADVPTAMTKKQTYDTIDAFGAATERAIAAGYDGVELHGANTYLLQQFFSPHSNRRHDIWGGGRVERMRFPLAVIEAVQSAARGAGRPFAVGYRLSPEEVERPGISIKDTVEFVEQLCGRGLDWIHVSLRDFRSVSVRNPSDKVTPLARVIEAVQRRVPIIGAGSVITAEDATEMLGAGCNLCALGRILLMEPEWAARVRDGGGEPIRTTLPARDGDTLLTIPHPMYERLLKVRGWLPVEN